MEKIKVLGISGSLRTESYNRKALQIAKRFATEAGAEVKETDLRELALPIYDGEIEAKGVPESVAILKAAVETADLLLIASPEYNGSVSGALKNAIDWLTRGKNSLDGKTAAVFGASTGMFGTIRGQIHLRYVLGLLNVQIAQHPMVHIRLAAEAFNADGSLKDPKTAELLRKLVGNALKLAGRLKEPKS